MRKIIGFVTCAALAIACGSTPVGGGETTASEGAAVSAAVPKITAAQVNALAKGENLKIELPRPGAVVQVDVSSGRVNLSRVEISVAGRTATAQSLEQQASAAAKFTPAYGSFYIVAGGGQSLLARPVGGGRCSTTTQTDCCECGWETPEGDACLGFWCPCFGDECGGPPVFEE